MAEVIDALFRPFIRSAPQETSQKAMLGPGATVMSWGTPISDVTRNAQQMMKEAQAVYARGNRWVKRAEQVISGRVGSVAWHLEIDGETINDESSEELQAYVRIFEMPLGDERMARAYPGQPRTRREMWGLTSRHMGLCNVGFWYLDEINGLGWPKRIFFIRPDRLTPDETGGSLKGWVLDKDSGNGTALSLEEVLPFYLDPPDRGYFGSGLVESIFSTILLPNSIDRHAIDTLSSGGRLPGIYSPKDREGDDVFDRLVSDLRTIKDMPDSSKRDVVARAPITFTPTAADMNSLVVTALASTSRDDTLAHWGVPYGTIGGPTAGGLNSGESRKYDEAALWQNAVQFRIDGMYETIQYRLLDRLGMGIQLVIETPTFDDDSPKFEIAAKALNLPLTNNERRALVGLDPFQDESLGNMIVMPMQIVEYGTSVSSRPADDIPLEGVQAKASLDATVRKTSESRLTKAVAKVLAEMGRDIAQTVRAKGDLISKKPGDFTTWLPASKRAEWEAALNKALTPSLSLAAETVGERVEAKIGKPAKADPLETVLPKMMKSVGRRITGILDTTRDQVRKLIEKGVAEGMGAAELGDLIEDHSTFSEYRAELIARTETAQVLNEAQLESFREFGVAKVVAIDGDDDPECAARDGQEYDLEEALAIQDHPNGTLDWSPVLGGS